MTYISLYACAFSPDVTAAELEAPGTKSTYLWSPSTYSRDHGVALLLNWAERRGLEVHWIDNCWIRVPVSRSELDSFILSEVGEQPALAAASAERLVLEAEEY